jgi:uncharacterized protein (UPF0128 family)
MYSKRAILPRQHKQVSLSTLMGSLDSMAIPPTQIESPRNARKNWQDSEHLRAITGAGRYKVEAFHKARVGTNRPRLQNELSGCVSPWPLPSVAWR